MGELLTQLRKDNMQAMKEKDTLKKGVLSLLISAIALGEKEKHEALTKDEELVYVQKELKQTKEALAETPADRTDAIEETKKKIQSKQEEKNSQKAKKDEIDVEIAGLEADVARINEVIDEKNRRLHSRRLPCFTHHQFLVF